MKLTTANLQQIMQYLRNTAEVDPNDVIANAASDLAYRLEGAGTSVFNMLLDFNTWSDSDQRTAKYAIGKREQYIRPAGSRHAVDLQRVEKPRRKLPKRLTKD
jgi:hypothetical protein